MKGVFRIPPPPLVEDRNTFQRSFFESLRLPFQRELHIPLQASPFSEGRGCNRPTRCSNRYAIRLADHQRSAPGFCAGWDRIAVWILTACFCIAADNLLLHWMLKDCPTLLLFSRLSALFLT